MNVQNTRKSLEVEVMTGTLPQRSVRDVVVPSIQTGRLCFSEELQATPETIVVLTSMLLGMLGEQLSEDAIWLSMGAAKNICNTHGVSDEEFERVERIVMEKWRVMKNRHPMAGMF